MIRKKHNRSNIKGQNILAAEKNHRGRKLEEKKLGKIGHNAPIIVRFSTFKKKAETLKNVFRAKRTHKGADPGGGASPQG